VEVRHVPSWVSSERLLGSGEWAASEGGFAASLTTREACDLSARLRGVGLGGRKVEVVATPKLPRAPVRAARLEDARSRRKTSAGFSKRGCRLDAEGKWSLTPERLALEIGARVRGRSVVDATCGAGGNAIGFARNACDVLAVDLCRARVDLARRNAAIYGVGDKIHFAHGDARRLPRDRRADVLFVDPPWGTDWNRERTKLDDLPLLRDMIHLAPKRNFKRLLAKVPPSFDPSTTPGAAPEAIFGHETGDYRRVKFVLLDFDLAKGPAARTPGESRTPKVKD
jgi:SAM-dependent methyltransferase